MSRRSRGLLLAILAGTCLSGCSEYLDRRDSLLLGSGEAVQTNIVAHVIDPWPPASRRTSADTDGQRLQGAVERYRNPGTTSASSTASASGGTAPPAAAAASSPSLR